MSAHQNGNIPNGVSQNAEIPHGVGLSYLNDLETTQRVLESRRVLEDRALLLAREPEQARDTSESLEVLEFMLGAENFAIETQYVREVLPSKEITPLPCTPDFVLGMVNARGQIVSVIDIRRFFGAASQGPNTSSKIMVVRWGEMEFGILAEVVIGMRFLAPEEIKPPPVNLAGARVEYLKGVTAERLLVLNLAVLAGDSRIVVHEEVV